MKILCPLDGSQRSLDALVNGLAMFKGADVKVTLFAVQHEGFENAPEDIVEEFEADTEDEIFPTHDSCKEMLDSAKEALRGFKVTQTIVEGNVVKQIVEATETHDILLMHALNRSGLLEGLRMSNTEKIARKAACSVLLVADMGKP